MKNVYYLIGALISGFLSNAQAIQFQPYVEIQTPADAKFVGIGDFNSDGRKDVAVITGFSDGNQPQRELLIYRQNATGGLEQPQSYTYAPISYLPTGLAVADINLDGRDDVIICHGTKVGMFLQTADGTMASQVVLEVNTLAEAVTVGHFNSDNLPDIAVAGGADGGNILRIVLQTSIGNFSPYSTPTMGESQVYSVTHGDVNTDGKTDIIVAGQNGIRVFLQNASNLFNAYTAFAQAGTNYTATGDWDSDGDIDIAFSYGGNSPGAFIGRIRNNSGTLQLATPLAAYDIPECVAIVDLNGDGKNDIATVHGGWNKASAYRQLTPGNFAAYSMFPLPYASSYENAGMAVGDLNNDGSPDLAFADYNHGLVILYNMAQLGVGDNGALLTKIWPNPAKENVFVSAAEGILSAAVFDSRGKKVFTRTFDGDARISLETEQLDSGLYLIQLTTYGGVETHKIIIK